MRISIFGLGYVGAVSMACLARDGHTLTGVDPDETKLNLIHRGISPIVEPGVQELLANAVAVGRIAVTPDPAAAIRVSDLSFVCVGTPSNAVGSHDLSAITRVTEQIGAAIGSKSTRHVVVVRSTLPPGTLVSTIIPLLESTSGKKEGEHFDVCFQPEFLREGTSIQDYDHPPFTVLGRRGSRERAEGLLSDLFGGLPGEVIFTDCETAEMLKFCCNAFHAVKVTFANEVGRLSRSVGIDARKVMELLVKDTRLNVSPAYLRPGFAFGGSCLPKDLRALMRLAQDRNVDVPMLSRVTSSNRAHIDHAGELVMEHGRRPVGLIGLAFKSGTDDLRESPLVNIAEFLLGKGVPLKIYDPQVQLARLRGSNKRYIDGVVPHLADLLTEDLDGLIEKSETIVVGAKSAEVLAALARADPGKHIVDLVSLPQPLPQAEAYSGVCW